MRIYHPGVTILAIMLFMILAVSVPSSAEELKAMLAIDTAPIQLDPEHEQIKPRVSYVPGLKIIRGATQVIVPAHKSFCPAGSVFRFNNGDIQVYDRRSSDGGKTWQQVEHIQENSTYQYPDPDGEVIMFRSSFTGKGSTGAGRPEVSLVPTDKEGVFEAKFFRSSDHGLSRIAETATIYLPEHLNGWSGVLCRKIVRLDDDSLLMSMYCRKEGGTALELKRRTLVLRSTDRGKTWHYRSTIAFDMSEDARGEGFDETALLVLPEGKLLAFMRSGASYQASIGSFNNNDPEVDMPHGYAKQSPVYMSTSIDGGYHWSIPDPVSPYGVWPDAIRMENGIIAVSYGRPGNWLMFSQDDGQSWGPIIPFFNDLYPPDCSNYFSLAEVAPGVLLAVYSRTDPNDHWQSELVGTYFHVKRDKQQ